MTEWEKLSRAVRRSDNLRLPRDPEKAARNLLRTVNEIVRKVRKDGAA